MSATDVVIIASGGANIASLQFALERLQTPSCVSADAGRIRAASHVILPGVGAAADFERLEWFGKGDHARVLETMDEFYRFRPEARFGHYLMMIGALGEGDCRAPSRQYGEYENSIGTGQVHLWFDRPGGGFPRPRRTPVAAGYVRQNAGPELTAAG